MTATATTEIGELEGAVGRFLAERSPLDRLRERLRKPDGEHRSEVWAEATALGYTSLGVPEHFGGGGCSAEVVGAALATCAPHLPLEPFLTTMALTTPLLCAAGNDLAAELLRGVASGESTVAVAGAAPAGRRGAGRLTAFPAAAGTWRVGGDTEVVVDGAGADWVIVSALDGTEQRWFALERARLGEPSAAGTLIDGHSTVRFFLDDIAVPDDCLLGGPALTDALLDRGAPLVGAWLLGLTRRAFDLTLFHLRERHQFGVPIGSFQALQHRMAQLHCDVVVAEAVLEAALRHPSGLERPPALYASLAKLRLGELALAATRTAIHYHGGLGMTAESDVGLYYKAAWTANLLAGDHHFHRGRATSLLGLERTPTRSHR